MLNPKHAWGPKIPQADLDDFRASLQGQVIRPEDADYDDARRAWNGMIDKHPALIARCLSAEDVVRSVQFAYSQNLGASIRGGAHNVAGLALCDDGLVVDLSRMKAVTVDRARRTVRAGAGLKLGEYVDAVESQGFVTPVGTASDTGIAGLTLGGGMGWLMGVHGLTIDNLRSVEVVTADGRQLKASADENSDLFWAVRGGGGNFGVVTTFEYDLHPTRPLLAGMVAHPAVKAREVLRRYRDFIGNTPDELTAYANFATSPDGHPIVAIAACYSGSLDEGEKALAAIRQFGPPVMDTFHPMSYAELTRMIDPMVPPGRPYYEKGQAIEDLSDGAIDTIAEHTLGMTSPHTLAILQHIHGKAARVGTADTAAFALRGDHIELTVIAGWEDGAAERHIAWTRALHSALEPYSIGTAYVNGLNEDGPDRVRKAYGDNYPRLTRIKAKYDPMNFFRLNQNIKPRAK